MRKIREPLQNLLALVILLFDNLVALARKILEAVAIQYPNVAAMVIDKSILPKAVRRDAHPGAAHAQHARQEFLGQGKGIAYGPVVRHQQPPRQTLVQSVQAITSGGLRYLNEH